MAKRFNIQLIFTLELSENRYLATCLNVMSFPKDLQMASHVQICEHG